jgi:hypothetical protein
MDTFQAGECQVLVEINIIPDNWSPQKRYLGAKVKGKPPRALTHGPDTASVILIKYEDYECTYSALWETVIEFGLHNKSTIGETLFSDDRRLLVL